VLPTILESLDLPIPDGLAGTPIGRGDSAIAEMYFAQLGASGPVYMDNLHSSRPTAWALVEAEWKLMLISDGSKRLSRALDNADHETNLADSYPQVVVRMEERLRSLLPPGAFTDYLQPTTTDRLDESTLERLRGLGYIR